MTMMGTTMTTIMRRTTLEEETAKRERRKTESNPETNGNGKLSGNMVLTEKKSKLKGTETSKNTGPQMKTVTKYLTGERRCLTAHTGTVKGVKTNGTGSTMRTATRSRLKDPRLKASRQQEPSQRSQTTARTVVMDGLKKMKGRHGIGNSQAMASGTRDLVLDQSLTNFRSMDQLRISLELLLRWDTQKTAEAAEDGAPKLIISKLITSRKTKISIGLLILKLASSTSGNMSLSKGTPIKLQEQSGKTERNIREHHPTCPQSEAAFFLNLVSAVPKPQQAKVLLEVHLLTHQGWIQTQEIGHKK